MTNLKTAGILSAAILVVGVAPASASKCDLTANMASCGPIFNGAIFGEISPQPTGTGYVDPFLRLQENGIEEGYNTSFRPFQLDQKEPANFTHDLLLGAVPIVTVNGLQYRQFFLDINESKADQNRLLSLDELRLYISPTGNVHGYDSATKMLGSLSAVYDMDAGSADDNWILLDYGLNPGSGSGDMVAYIPNTLFTGSSTQFLYLYSKFGVHDEANASADAGFEEWWVGPATPAETPVPEPGSLALIGAGAALLILRRVHVV